MKVKGVNLGNWLVLEKWMSPALFEGTTAEDECSLPFQLPKEVYEARIKVHRSEYITERDFSRIKSMGMEAVRIPVPYFVFGDRPPFLGCIRELDKAFNWAERYGLKILIDLHTAPDSQNGFDNGGICGVCKWSLEPEEVEFELSVLERLAMRYGNRPGLWGIEVLNEPVLEDMWDVAEIQKRYPPKDREKAKGSKGISPAFLRRFYLDAYERARDTIDETTRDLISGIAFHWYSGEHFEALDMIRRKFPEKKLILSESCLEFGKYEKGQQLENAHRLAHDMIGNLNHGMNGFYDWNILLDEKGGPNHAENYCDAPYLFDMEKKTLERRMCLDYYWHFSHFIRPGAVRLASTRYTDMLDFTVWKNRDQEVVFVLLNRKDASVSCHIRFQGEAFSFEAAPCSIISGRIQ